MKGEKHMKKSIFISILLLVSLMLTGCQTTPIRIPHGKIITVDDLKSSNLTIICKAYFRSQGWDSSQIYDFLSQNYGNQLTEDAIQYLSK